MESETAKQILQSRQAYEKQLTQAAAPTPFSQSQTTMGAAGRGQGSFLAGIQYRQAVKGEKTKFKKQVTAAKDIFETSVAKGAPEYALPEYVERVYTPIQTDLKNKLAGVETQISKIQKSIAADPKQDKQSLERQRRDIEELQAKARGYREGLSMPKFEAIKAGQGNYFDELASAYALQKAEKFRVQDLNKIIRERNKALEQQQLIDYPEAKKYIENPEAKIAELGQQKEDYFNRVLEDATKAAGLTEPTADLVNKVEKQSQQYIIQQAKIQGITLSAFVAKPSGESSLITGGRVDIKTIQSVDAEQKLPIGVVTTTAPTFFQWGSGPDAYKEYATLGGTNIQIGGNIAEQLSGHSGALTAPSGGTYDPYTNTFKDATGKEIKLTTTSVTDGEITAPVTKYDASQERSDIVSPVIDTTVKFFPDASLSKISAPIVNMGTMTAGGYSPPATQKVSHKFIGDIFSTIGMGASVVIKATGGVFPTSFTSPSVRKAAEIVSPYVKAGYDVTGGVVGGTFGINKLSFIPSALAIKGVQAGVGVLNKYAPPAGIMPDYRQNFLDYQAELEKRGKESNKKIEAGIAAGVNILNKYAPTTGLPDYRQNFLDY